MELADFKATGDQTNKCSEKQYKYEEKMSGCTLTLKIFYAWMAELADALVLGTSTLCVWVRPPLWAPALLGISEK